MSQTDLEQTFPPQSLDTTLDIFLGDRLAIRQPRQGYRAGVDAVLLAACIRPLPGGPRTLLDVGAGAGAVGLCAASRLADLSAVLLERDPALAQLAHDNAAANGLSARVRTVTASVTSSADDLTAQGLVAESFDQAVANPPFHDEEAGTPAANILKAKSHAMPATGLEDWARFMARMVRPGGRATLIHKAEALARILDVMSPRFGALRILPIYARNADCAIRVIVEGIKGSRAPLQVCTPFVLHGEGQEFTPAATAILRHGTGLQI